MSNFRIKKHPILPIPEKKGIQFTWNGVALSANVGETISSALFANGVRIFGHHHKDGSPQGIFCANGQCAQCMVIANGTPVKSCMVEIEENMVVFPADGLPELPKIAQAPVMNQISEIDVPVLVIGGGPAGLSAAIELGKLGIKTLIIDDKHKLGGKLVLQTHRFFGSTQAVFAGTRGIDIATKLEAEIRQLESVEIWLQSTALAVFSDRKVGIQKKSNEYVLVKPQILLVVSGAREKFLSFKGNTIPGVYGAGAFQTLVNRDLVRPAERLFIVGGGNVGLIAGYHALQAGINVVGLVEALPECGGYKVHKDKLVRMGVQIMNSHTILSANGSDHVESVTIAKVNDQFQPIPGTEKSFECDTVLIAVGLDSVDEFYKKGVQYGIDTFVGGDAEEIAEASAAIFSGKIRGMEIAKKLGLDLPEIPQSWYRTSEILKSRPGAKTEEKLPEELEGVLPVIHCVQEIPCNPCASLCPHGLIYVDQKDIRQIPTFLGNGFCCEVCEQCVVGCPGLAITLVDYRNSHHHPIVSIPYEFNRQPLQELDHVMAMDIEGNPLGEFDVLSVHSIPTSDRTFVVQIQAPQEIASQIAGLRIQEIQISQPMDHYIPHIEDDMIVCRCERVKAGDIRNLIHQGYRDFNEIKTMTRAGMGSCGGKTCTSIIRRIFREEGIPEEEVTDQTKRPIFMEIPLALFAGVQTEKK
ncbi:MAG: sulfurtransferase [Chloroflexi bacterium HGW-Chloroflexi-10]|nr:MAG: sulfurtransferase [Chloroflexi bacterium HGW-Chloroflexi-10]